MSEIDDRREALRQRLALVNELLLRENLTEEDVRAKLIDPLFVHALGWPEAVIRREQHTTSGERIDYSFGHPAVYFLLEAKRADTPFTFPAPTVRKTHVIQSLAAKDKSLGSALDQVARYCQDEGHTRLPSSRTVCNCAPSEL